jgi:uroporphyrinogen-III decarboxylase
MIKIKKDIRYLLNTYEKLYSDNNIRINKSLERTTKALHHKKVDRVPIWQVSQTVLYPRHEIFFSPEKNLIMQLANIILTLEHKTDYVPYLDPFEGVTILAEAFGCPVEVPDNGDPWVRDPIIKSPHDVYSIKKPAKDNGVYKRIFDTLNFFEEETGFQIPVGATDPQGPLDIASLIWDNNNFLTACITNKKEVHYLLDIITEAFIEFYTMQYDILKNPAFPVHSFPLIDLNDGISISDDETILLSPDLFDEFGIPYLNRISDAFGGLYYHCCGDFGHVLDKILKIKGLRAINAHLSPKEFKPEYIKEVLLKGVGLFLGISDREIGWDDSNIWSPDKVINIYENYYIPNAIGESSGEGIVLIGYGGYMGYVDKATVSKTNLLVGTGGHTVNEGPLVNVPVEKKNRNFDHITKIIEKEKLK